MSESADAEDGRRQAPHLRSVPRCGTLVKMPPKKPEQSPRKPPREKRSTQPAGTDRLTFNMPEGMRDQIQQAIHVAALLGAPVKDMTGYALRAIREQLKRDAASFRDRFGSDPFSTTD